MVVGTSPLSPLSPPLPIHTSSSSLSPTEHVPKENDFQCLYVKDRNLTVDITQESKKRGTGAMLFTPHSSDNQVRENRL